MLWEHPNIATRMRTGIVSSATNSFALEIVNTTLSLSTVSRYAEHVVVKHVRIKRVVLIHCGKMDAVSFAGASYA